MCGEVSVAQRFQTRRQGGRKALQPRLALRSCRTLSTGTLELRLVVVLQAMIRGAVAVAAPGRAVAGRDG